MHNLIERLEEFFSWDTVHNFLCWIGIHDLYYKGSDPTSLYHTTRLCNYCNLKQWYYSGYTGEEWIDDYEYMRGVEKVLKDKGEVK